MGSLVMLRTKPLVFDPQATHRMGQAFDQAWARTSVAANLPLAKVRELLALAIIELAQCGESDVRCLRDWALNRLRQWQAEQASALQRQSNQLDSAIPRAPARKRSSLPRALALPAVAAAEAPPLACGKHAPASLVPRK